MRRSDSTFAYSRAFGLSLRQQNPHSVAAGMIIVREAGGFVTDFRGQDRAIERSEFLAANDVLHSKLHKLVAENLSSVPQNVVKEYLSLMQ